MGHCVPEVGRMRKLSFSDFTKSMTMLFINKEIDDKYRKLRAAKVESLMRGMSGIGTRAGLERYIRDHADALGNILVILGVSEEYFKRVTSTIRVSKGKVFSSEWSLAATRKYMLQDADMMDTICRLFLDGPHDRLFASLIPSYRLEHFVIDGRVMGRLGNPDFMDFLVGRDFDINYNNDQSTHHVHRLETILCDICHMNGLRLVSNHNVDPVGNGTRDINVNYEVRKGDHSLPRFYIKYSFNITTSNTQTVFKRSVKDLRDYIRMKNPEARQVTIVDGAGWMGRQADLRDVLDYSDYCLNLRHMEDIREIIR